MAAAGGATQACPNLTKLNLEDNKIGTDGAAALLSLLKSGALPRLTEIELGGNNIEFAALDSINSFVLQQQTQQNVQQAQKIAAEQEEVKQPDQQGKPEKKPDQHNQVAQANQKELPVKQKKVEALAAKKQADKPLEQQDQELSPQEPPTPVKQPSSPPPIGDVPKNAFQHYCTGLELYHSKNYDEAITMFDKAIEINPKYAEAYNAKGNAIFSLGKLDNLGKLYAAIIAYDKAIELNPNFAIAYYNNAIAEKALGNPKTALALLNKALELNPNDTLAYNAKGNVLLTLGDHKQAIVMFNKTLELKPDDSAAVKGKGLAEFALSSPVAQGQPQDQQAQVQAQCDDKSPDHHFKNEDHSVEHIGGASATAAAGFDHDAVF